MTGVNEAMTITEKLNLMDEIRKANKERDKRFTAEAKEEIKHV